MSWVTPSEWGIHALPHQAVRKGSAGCTFQRLRPHCSPGPQTLPRSLPGQSCRQVLDSDWISHARIADFQVGDEVQMRPRGFSS